MNQLFLPELIPDYMHAHPEYGVKRILTYTIYRFLSFAGKEDDTLAAYLKETLFPMEQTLDFSLIDDYLALDMQIFHPFFEERCQYFVFFHKECGLCHYNKLHCIYTYIQVQKY